MRRQLGWRGEKEYKRKVVSETKRRSFEGGENSHQLQSSQRYMGEHWRETTGFGNVKGIW